MRARRYPLPQQPRTRPRSAKAKKISITVDASVLREVREVVRKDGKKLSSHISETLARDLRRRRLQELIDEYEREHGELDQREMHRVRAQWQA
jgi:cytosine/adenosine deaminase-related metal-dependent hydrolase